MSHNRMSLTVGVLLQNMGLTTTCVKMDPYLNYDTTNLSPEEHGENFVLDDGTEVDLDFGTYERMLDLTLSGRNSITAGKIYRRVLDDERDQKYLGKTVQVIPHVTDAIVAAVLSAATGDRDATADVDVCLIELGGTVGDIESMSFVEAMRQLAMDHDVCVVHLAWVVELDREHKTKPAQHSLAHLRGLGLSPDVLVARSKTVLSDSSRVKLERFAGIPVIGLENSPDIADVPHVLQRRSMDAVIARKLNLLGSRPPLPSLSPTHDRTITVCIVGKYQHDDAYLSLVTALGHAAHARNADVRFTPHIVESDAVVVPGGFGQRYMDEKLRAARWSRAHGVPFLGICLGMQIAVLEYYRNVLGTHATSEEFSDDTDDANADHNHRRTVVRVLPDGKMRKGSHDVLLANDTIRERHRHRYYVRPEDVPEAFEVVGTDETGAIAEIVRMKEHPFYVGTQFHPEFSSRPTRPNPLFVGFVEAALRT